MTRERNDRLKSLRNIDAIMLDKLTVNTCKDILKMRLVQQCKTGSTLEKSNNISHKINREKKNHKIISIDTEKLFGKIQHHS